VVDEPGAVVLLDAGSCCGFDADPPTESRRADEWRAGEAAATDGCDPRSSTATNPAATIAAAARAATTLVFT
jgi:hypothetical protein